MRITSVLFRNAKPSVPKFQRLAFSGNEINTRSTASAVQNLTGLSDSNWALFLEAVKQECQPYKHLGNRGIDPTIREGIVERTTSKLAERGVVGVDSDAILWRASHLFSERRRPDLLAQWIEKWRASFPDELDDEQFKKHMSYLRRLNRQAFMEAEIDTRTFDNTWANVPQAQRDRLVARVNELVAKYDWPEPPAGLTLYRMMKIFHEVKIQQWKPDSGSG